MNDHRKNICNSQTVEKIHPSTGECIKNCGYLYNGVVFGNKNEWKADIYYNMDQPLKYYATWKKPDVKDHILNDFIYVKCPETVNL